MSRGKRMLSMILSDSNKESVIAKRKASYSRSEFDDKEKSEETVQLFESNRNYLSQKIYDSEEEFEELWQATEKIVHEAQNKTKFIEQKLAVGVGHAPDIDPSTLSEINLNSTSDDDIKLPQLSSHNIGEERGIQDESILSQAASSFSQLPSVASTVFSTFSKVLKDYTPNSGNTRENSGEREINQSSLTACEPYPPVSNPVLESEPNYNFYKEPSQPLPDPPKLYSPAEIQIPNLSSQPNQSNNNYRLSAKRKAYAPVPGLSVSSTAQINQPNHHQETVSNLPPPVFSNPVQPAQSPFGLQDIPNISTPSQIPEFKAETTSERKGLFSFSNLVPPVLQNISGFVQNTISSNEKINREEHTTINQRINQTSQPDSVVQQLEFTENQPSIYGVQTSNPVYYNTASNFEPNLASTPANAPPPGPPPPLINTGTSNFRLQKGTRHYKSAFEGTSVHVCPPEPSNTFTPLGNISAGIQPISHSATYSETPPQNPFQKQHQVDSVRFFNPQVGTETSNTNTFLEITQIPAATTLFNPTADAGVQLEPEQNTNLDEESFYSKFTTNNDLTQNSKSEGIIDNTQLDTPTNEEHLSSPPIGFDQLQIKDNFVLSTPLQKSSETKPEQTLLQSLNINSENFEGQSPVEKKLEQISIFTPTPIEENYSNPTAFYSFPKQLPEKEPFTFTSCSSDVSNSQIEINPIISDAIASVVPPNIETSALDLSQSEKPSSIAIANEGSAIFIYKEPAFSQINVFPVSENTTTSQVKSEDIIEQPINQSFNLNSYFSGNTIDKNPIIEEPVVTSAIFTTSDTIVKETTSQSFEVDSNANVASFFNTNPTQNTTREDTANSNFQLNPNLSETLPDPSSFFDSFSQVGQTEPEDVNSFRIQNFFNNPPQNLSTASCDLNYNLVGSGITGNQLKTLTVTDNWGSRALSPLSNVVEPPSSSCSEFSSEISSQFPPVTNKIVNEEIIQSVKSEDQLDTMATLIAGSSGSTNMEYCPAPKHWFYKKNIESKFVWTPFSYRDSALIEDNFASTGGLCTVPVEGGRYDVNIPERTRIPIFWSGKPSEVRRCSWFYKSVDSRYVPYEEDTSAILEEEYKQASQSGEWRRKIELVSGETVVFHGPTVMVHFLQSQTPDAWGSAPQTTNRPRVVKRDIDEFSIEEGDSYKVDHILFMVHGIGSACDLKFRTVEEVVDEFRSIAMQLVQGHYKNSCDSGHVGRVEVLPVSWHSELHSEESGIDEKLKAITLESIPKLRNFANDTLLDVLFYTSPVFCQNIMDTVAGTMNKVYLKYCQRNPGFNGGVSLAGHSLGSLILFDLLCHQHPIADSDIQNSENPDQVIKPLQLCSRSTSQERGKISKQISYTIGHAGTGQPFINYPQLVFEPRKFFALGSPIGMFVTIRGIDALGLDFKLPTCGGFFNIFHPYDPVAYRIEALVNPDLSSLRPVLIPHHKGRKRMHLELKETMTRVGADLKQRFLDTFNNTLGSVYQLASKNKPDPKEIEQEVDKVLNMQLNLDNVSRSRNNSTSTQSDVDTGETDMALGSLNEMRRIDYVLQEAPVEFFNEYLFALTSHVCYWESPDTILFIVKEIYSSLGVAPDSQLPQHSMTIERPLSRSTYNLSPTGEQRSSN